jgi:hypothetical protein
MKIVENNILPLRGFAAINLFGVLFVRRGVKISPSLIQHETIHSRQMRELLYVPFYLLYFMEWLVRLCIHGVGIQAYRNISFEREANTHEHDEGYLATRRAFAFLRYLMRSK